MSNCECFLLRPESTRIWTAVFWTGCTGVTDRRVYGNTTECSSIN